MTEFWKVEAWHIEGQLPICPRCKDTQFVTSNNTLKLVSPAKLTLTCGACDVAWELLHHEREGKLFKEK